MEDSDEEGSYKSSPYKSECEESNQVWSDEEDDYAAPPWPGDENSWSLDGYSSSDIGEESDVEEFEPDPPQDRDDSEHEDSAHGEEDQTIEPYQRPWCEITDSEISSRDGDHVDDDHWSLETEPEDTSVEESKFEEENQESNGENINYTKQDEIDDAPTEEEADCEPYYICFSGHKQGPEAYLQWENEMENWFRSHNIPKEERLTYAINSLDEEASTWWEREELGASYNNLAISWGNMKQRMYREFVQKSHNRSYIPKRSLFQTTTRSWTPTPKPQPVSKSKKTCCPEPKKVPKSTLEKQAEVKKPVGVKEFKPAPKQTDASQTPSTQPKHEPRVKTEQCKSSKALKINDTICYRCHKRGHFAAVCPERQEIKIAKPEPKLNSLDSCLENSSFKFLNSDLMRLSLPKAPNAGQGQNVEHHEATMSCLDAEKDGGDTSFILVQEEPPDYMLNTKTVAMKETELKDSPAQVSPSLQLVSNEYNSVMVNFTNTEEYEEDLVSKETYSDQIAKLKICFNGKLEEMLQTEFCFSVYKNSMTVIMHLSLVKSVEIIAGTKEKNATHEPLDSPYHNQGEPRGDSISERRNFAKKDEIMCRSNKHGVIYSMLIKEEPPDAKHQLHPSHNQNRTRGNLLNLHLYQGTNLLSLRAGYTVSRTKLFQEGENDEDIKSSSTMEQRINIGVPQVMMRRIKTSLRTVLFFLHCGFIPMGFPGKVLTRQQLIGAQETKANCSSLTTTWITSSSQLENTSKWNQPSIRSHEGDIKLTSHVNPNLLDSDICGIIGGFRPNQRESSYEPNCSGILTHYRTSEAWNRTKINFGLGDIQFLIQTFLGLPYLESHEFGQHQTYLWRPGDFNTDLEASLKVLQCSNTQNIRRILSFLYLPKLSRYKPQDFPCLDRFAHQFSNGYILPNCMRFLSVF